MAPKNRAARKSTESAPARRPSEPKPYSSGVKENEQDPNAVPGARLDLPNPKYPQVDEELERQKARGQTESQKREREFYEGRFQTNDPATGKKRDKHDSVREDAE